MEKFDKFYINDSYISMKNSLFNYLNRQKAIKDLFDKNINYKKNLKMVDIGCGISPVSPVPDKTLFIDISKEAVNYLNKIGHNAKHGSMTKIPLKSESVDVVFCSEVLEHVKDYNLALREMRRILKKSGRLILTVPVYKKYWGFDDEFVGHLRRFEPIDFKKELSEAGFKVIKEEPIGSLIERKLTQMTVKLFRNQKEKKSFGKAKIKGSKIINYLLYLIVRGSLRLNSKKSTSIMLYYC